MTIFDHKLCTFTDTHLAAAWEVMNPTIAGLPLLVVPSNVIPIGLFSQQPTHELRAISPHKPAFLQNGVSYDATNLVKCDGGMLCITRCLLYGSGGLNSIWP